MSALAASRRRVDHPRGDQRRSRHVPRLVVQAPG
jgi:hypothetical protein